MIWLLLGAVALLLFVLINAATTNPDKPREFDSNWWRANQVGCLLMFLIGAALLAVFLVIVL